MPHMTSWVHRYTLRELMDDTFDLFKERAIELLLAGLLPGCLIVIYQALMLTFYIPGSFIQHYTSEADFLELAKSAKFWVFILGFSAVSSIAYSAMLVAQCRIAMDHALGKPVSVVGSFRKMAKPVASLIFIVGPIFSFFSAIAIVIALAVGGLITGIMAGIATAYAATSVAVAAIAAAIGVAVMVLLAIFAFMIISTLFLTAPVPLACEHAGPFRAIGRAFSIASSNMKAHFSSSYVVSHLLVVPLLLLVLVFSIMYMPLQFLGHSATSIAGSVLEMIFTAACSGLMICLMVLAYLDGSSRLDILDLKLMAADIGLGEAFDRAMQPAAAAARQTHYPNYASTPGAPAQRAPQASAYPYSAAPGAGATAYPDYSAPPPQTGQAQTIPAQDAPPAQEQPQAPQGQGMAAPVYLNYAAPPPVNDPAPVAVTVPDYSAPPPPPPGAETSGVTSTDQREGEDAP